MQITIINDCCDENAKLRQVSRAGSLIKYSSANCFGARSEMEAAGFLVDAIDAIEGREGAILVNVAPRNSAAKKWKNGAPFGYFRYDKTLIVSSSGGMVLSLAKKLGIVKEFYITDIPEALNSINDSELDKDTKARIINSQFRSFDYLPRLAAWILERKNIPCKQYDLEDIPETLPSVWFIDNFGNIKTTLLSEDLPASDSDKVELKIGDKNYSFSRYDRLKDIPLGTIGLVVGSSGIKNKRFLEIMARGANAAQMLEIKENALIKVIGKKR